VASCMHEHQFRLQVQTDTVLTHSLNFNMFNRCCCTCHSCISRRMASQKIWGDINDSELGSPFLHFRDPARHHE